MAPNPSAALRVVLAASLAAGPLRPAVAFAAPEPAAPPTEPGKEFNVLQVGDVVPIFNGIMLRTKDLAGLKNGQEKEVDAVIPTKMERQGTFTAHTYKLIGKTEKVKVKLVYEYRSTQPGRWQVYRAGKWVAGRDGKTATFEGCIPNGDRRCFNGITGVARNFIVVASATTPPAPVPPGPKPPAPVPPAPVPPAPVPPAPVPPAPPREPAEPDTLKDWAFVPNEDGTVLALGKGTYEGAKAKGASCPAGFVTVPAYKLAFAADDKDKPLSAAAEDQGKLKFYKTAASGQPVAQCPKGKDCEAEGTDVRLSPFCADAAQCPKLTINRPKENRGDTPFTAADLARSLAVKAGTAALSGKTVVAPVPSKECTGTANPPAPPDPHAADLKKLLGDDESALTLAKLAQRVWKGEPTFAAVLAEALKNPDAAKGKAAFLEKMQAAILADNGNPAIRVLKEDSTLKAAFTQHHCKPAPRQTTAPVKTTGDKKELQQVNAEGIERMTTGGGAPASGAVSTQPIATGGNPYEAICRSIMDQGNPTPNPGPGTGVPDIVNEKPANTDDSEAKSKAAEETKNKKNFQRMMIGGAGGAIVLGVFGFIFGGPIGALAMGALGFGIMAGVTHMNNNPIE